MSQYIASIDYETFLGSGKHWSLKMRSGSLMRLTDVSGRGNLGMLFYNPENLLERYNAPDTLKCQHTFKLSKGHCLYSDMGRVFASIVEDSLGWHETVAGSSNKEQVNKRWGQRDYQQHRNHWKQNGRDAFLVELAKYGLGKRDMAANINWFSKISVNENGAMQWQADHSSAGSSVLLRFEMDTLVIMHSCPHPLNNAETYPRGKLKIELGRAQPVLEDDYCKNFRPENIRGFANNALYNLNSHSHSQLSGDPSFDNSQQHCCHS